MLLIQYGKIPGDEAEHCGHIFRCPVSIGPMLQSWGQAVVSLHECGRNPSDPVGQGFSQMPFGHQRFSHHRLEKIRWHLS